MDNIDKNIKDYYQSRRLNPEQLKNIQRATGKESSYQSNRFLPFKYAAAILLLISSVYLFYFLPNNRQQYVLNGFATEVAYNHKKELPPEFLTSDVGELNAKLDKLNFQIALDDRVLTNRELIGGRYCSVDNRIAAQLKLEDDKGDWYTCYIFKKTEDFSFDQIVQQNETTVELWDKDDLIYAIAKTN